MQKPPRFIKAFRVVLKRFFHSRNIIIISDHKVDHIPLSGLMQILLVVGVVGFFSGISYITGSYMTARSAIHDRDQKIANTTIEKTRIGEEMSLLRHDLDKLRKNGQELSTYSKFVLDQYELEGNKKQPSIANEFSINLGSDTSLMHAMSNDKLLDRIAFLETHLQEAKEENDHLVFAIREHTNKKMKDFENIIAMTGLDSDRLTRDAKATMKGSGNATAARKVPVEPVTEDNAKDEGEDNQGGPYIPFDDSALSDPNRELLKNVDRVVMLKTIIEQLPLRYPVEDAQLMSPFGTRHDPINGHYAMHPGLDLAGPMGSTIRSTNTGTVVFAGRKAAYGNAVDIEHGFGIVTRYAHMSKILVNEGDPVAKGQPIGVQGSTGRSTGPHLHYEVRINDRPVNPAKFLHAGEYVLEE